MEFAQEWIIPGDDMECGINTECFILETVSPQPPWAAHPHFPLFSLSFLLFLEDLIHAPAPASIDF